MNGRATILQRAGLDLCAAIAVKGVDLLALAGAARRRLNCRRSRSGGRMQSAGAGPVGRLAAVAPSV